MTDPSTLLGLLGWSGLVAGLTCAAIVAKLWRVKRGRTTAGLLAALLGFAIAGLLLAAGATALWLRYRPQPQPLVATAGEGLVYRRTVRSEPRPLVIHVAQIDLRDSGWELVMTPPRPDGTFAAATVRDFARKHDVELAVNAQYFAPLMPVGDADGNDIAEGDPVRVIGFAARDGHTFAHNRWHDALIHTTVDGRVDFGEPDHDLDDALSGRYVLVRDGRPDLPETIAHSPAPRTALGLDAARDTMWLVVVDGRQRGWSEGMTLAELAALMAELGSDVAIELDGGGSSTMVMRESSGQLRLLNSPIHRRIPGHERPVANHLGVRRRA